MLDLKECVISPEQLEKSVNEYAKRHKYYNIYTSMDRAMAMLLTGELYISNGQGWNDKPDRVAMDVQSAYGICTSCSTMENIAMWMLYSGDKGKNGAMIQFTRTMMLEILESAEIEIGSFDKEKVFHGITIPKTENGDYRIYLTDVIYTEKLENDRVKLSLGESHVTVDEAFLEQTQLFTKNYGWSYEKECRLIIKLSNHWKTIAKTNDYRMIKITLSEATRRALAKRVVRSPIYKGKAVFGKLSALHGEVEWDI